MGRLHYMLCKFLLLCLFPTYLHAQVTIKSKPQDVVYVEEGKTLRLTVRFTYSGAAELRVTWLYNNTLVNTTDTGKKNIPDKNMTLVEDNTSLKNNGTYSVLFLSVFSQRLDFTVIIVVKPTAAVSCPSNVIKKEGDNFSCICNAIGGNPPPSATWSKNGTEIGSGYLTKELVYENVTKYMSGNYTCAVRSHNLTDSKLVVVLVKSRPTAKTNCSATTTADEGQSIFCLCEAEGGNPAPDASWFNAADESLMTRTLSLENVQRQDRGKYICKANSLDLEDETSVQVLVRFKPEINNFSSDAFHNRAEAGSTVKISCRAGGYPDVNVSIHNRGNVLTTACAALGVYTISSVKSTDAGEYKCVAKNSLGTAEKRLNITVSASTANNLTTPGNGKSTTGIEWYIALVALLVGILVGIGSVFAVMRLRRRLRRREDSASTSPQSAGSTGRRPEGSQNAVYQELDLKKMNEGDNYQSLRENFRNARSNQAVEENEGGYQELNKIRERGDENYQSLNRV